MGEGISAEATSALGRDFIAGTDLQGQQGGRKSLFQYSLKARQLFAVLFL